MPGTNPRTRLLVQVEQRQRQKRTTKSGNGRCLMHMSCLCWVLAAEWPGSRTELFWTAMLCWSKSLGEPSPVFGVWRSIMTLPLSSLLLVFLTDNLNQASTTTSSFRCCTWSVAGGTVEQLPVQWQHPKPRCQQRLSVRVKQDFWFMDPIYYASATQWYRPDTQPGSMSSAWLSGLPSHDVHPGHCWWPGSESSSPQGACPFVC